MPAIKNFSKNFLYGDREVKAIDADDSRIGESRLRQNTVEENNL